MTPGPRILYDASLANNPAGTGSFVRGLLAGLDHHQPAVEVIASSFESGSGALDSRHKNPVLRLRNSVRHLAYYLQTLPQRAEQLDCDLIFCPSSLVPLRNRRPFVMTVFDLTPLRFGSTQEWLSKQYLAAMLRTGIHRARIICTISQAIGDEILARFPGIEASRMRVTYPGPNPELLAADATPVPVPNRPFVLMVGTVEPRKNHLTVLRALADHVKRQPQSELMLVISGSAGWRYGPIIDAIAQLKLGDRVIRLGSVAPGSLKWLYLNARALLFPSLYEGFGLPVLEALYLDCPVVASRLPSVLEITGAEATLLPPTDVPAWAAAVDACMDGRGPATSRESARRRASRFTWEACAASAVDAVRAALDRPA